MDSKVVLLHMYILHYDIVTHNSNTMISKYAPYIHVVFKSNAGLKSIGKKRQKNITLEKYMQNTQVKPMDVNSRKAAPAEQHP